jgi:hypothetical protein
MKHADFSPQGPIRRELEHQDWSVFSALTGLYSVWPSPAFTFQFCPLSLSLALFRPPSLHDSGVSIPLSNYIIIWHQAQREPKYDV